MPLGLFGSSTSNGPKPKPLTSEKDTDGYSGGPSTPQHHGGGKEFSALELKEGRSTAVKLGKKSYTVERKLAEGGFALVYLVVDKHNRNYALKRQLVKDDPRQLEACRTESQIVKSLNGHKNIIAYVDHQLTVNKQSVYDYMLLTVYYPTNVLQLMNTRLLANRWLSTTELLDIFCDVVEAVARLHHSKTPVIHRDLKVENVLIDQRSGNEKSVYVLCDFGSATTKVLSKATHTHQFMEDEIQRYTTLSYRAPEMVDLYSGVPIDTKSDCWALGVLLYKLCYFNLPFGESALAIQSGQFSFPMQEEGRVPDELKAIINLLLTSNAKYRPNIYQTATLAFAAGRRAKCPVYNIEKSLRIELSEAVEILHLREKLGANYTQMFEKAFEEFEAQHRTQPSSSSSKGASTNKSAAEAGKSGAGVGAATETGGIKPSPSQLLSSKVSGAEPGMGSGAKTPTHSATPGLGPAHQRPLAGAGVGKMRSPLSASADAGSAAGSEVVEGVIVNTNANAPYTSSNALSSVTTSVNPRLRPKASASLHHTSSASMALPPAPAAGHAACISTAPICTAKVSHSGKEERDVTAVVKPAEQQQAQRTIATTPRNVAGTLPVAAAHSTLASCLRSSAFQPYTIASSQRKAIQQQLQQQFQPPIAVADSVDGVGRPPQPPIRDASRQSSSYESSNPFTATTPTKGSHQSAGAVVGSSMDDAVFGEHFDELRRNRVPAAAHLPGAAGSSTNPFIEHESPPTTAADADEWRKLARDFEEDPFGRAPPLSPQQRKSVRL